MILNKINPSLERALEEYHLTNSNRVQETTFSTIKSGADCIIIAPPNSGKSTAISISIVQQLGNTTQESPRALIIVENKEKVLEMEAIFEKLGHQTPLKVFGIHDKGNTEYDKNHISTGIDILIGTPIKMSEMFTGAGYNVNRIKIFVIDDANAILKIRHETRIMRISNSINKTQRIIFTDKMTEKVEMLAEKILIRPVIFNFDDDK